MISVLDDLLNDDVATKNEAYATNDVNAENLKVKEEESGISWIWRKMFSLRSLWRKKNDPCEEKNCSDNVFLEKLKTVDQDAQARSNNLRADLELVKEHIAEVKRRCDSNANDIKQLMQNTKTAGKNDVIRSEFVKRTVSFSILKQKCDRATKDVEELERLLKFAENGVSSGGEDGSKVKMKLANEDFIRIKRQCDVTIKHVEDLLSLISVPRCLPTNVRPNLFQCPFPSIVDVRRRHTRGIPTQILTDVNSESNTHVSADAIRLARGSLAKVNRKCSEIVPQIEEFLKQLSISHKETVDYDVESSEEVLNESFVNLKHKYSVMKAILNDFLMKLEAKDDLDSEATAVEEEPMWNNEDQTEYPCPHVAISFMMEREVAPCAKHNETTSEGDVSSTSRCVKTVTRVDATVKVCTCTDNLECSNKLLKEALDLLFCNLYEYSKAEITSDSYWTRFINALFPRRIQKWRN